MCVTFRAMGVVVECKHHWVWVSSEMVDFGLRLHYYRCACGATHEETEEV